MEEIYSTAKRLENADCYQKLVTDTLKTPYRESTYSYTEMKDAMTIANEIVGFDFQTELAKVNNNEDDYRLLNSELFHMQERVEQKSIDPGESIEEILEKIYQEENLLIEVKKLQAEIEERKLQVLFDTEDKELE